MQSEPHPNNAQKSKPAIPETVGATSAPFELGKRATTISFDVHMPIGPGLLRKDGHRKRVLLRVENVKSLLLAPPFDVYLNLPPGEEPERHPDLHAFTMSTFGLVESSKTRGNHPGNGLSFLEDVTDVLQRLIATKDWDGKVLQVSFVPSSWGDHPIKVEVGRVSLLIE